MAETLVEMRNISKRFGGVQALKKVSFSIRKGEIVCLLGENGAGKSTLIKILAGVYPANDGTISFDGESVRFKNTRDAYDRGISIVFQELNLCPYLSVMENLFLGNEVQRWSIVSYRRMREKAEQVFSNLKTRINPSLLVKDLGIAQQQMIEVAKALSYHTKILIMDEPTSALAENEIQNLFKIVRNLKSKGVSIVFISHKLKEVLEISDRIVCLKDGENSGEVETGATDENRLVSMMVGRELDHMYTRRKGEPSAEVVFEVNNLSGPPSIKDVSFQLRKGEIVGLAGLIGAGRTELAMLIVGAKKKKSGRFSLNGREVTIKHPADALANRIAYLSEDRKALGLILSMTVRENTTMSIHQRIRNRFGFIRAAEESRVTEKYIQLLQTRLYSQDQRTRDLSGGNQQKVALAKSLAIEPQVLILDEPTRGIDVGAKAEVHKLIADLADAGVAILMISSELPEILHVADRVLVMHEGRLTANLQKPEANEEAIMKYAIA